MYFTINTLCEKWEKSDKYHCIPWLDQSVTSFICANKPPLSAVPVQFRAPFIPILYVCVRGVIKPSSFIFTPISLALHCVGGRSVVYFFQVGWGSLHTLTLGCGCSFCMVKPLFTHTVCQLPSWIKNFLPRGIMERYLPRNLLAMVISCHRVQPRWEITWCAAAGGWWLTLDEI